MSSFKPMRSIAPDWAKYPVTFPKWASPKLDGIRVVKRNGKALTKAMKPVPNHFIRNYIETFFPEDLDGEIIVGPPNLSEETYNRTFRSVATHLGEPDFKVYAFDLADNKYGNAKERFELLQDLVADEPRIVLVEQTLIHYKELLTSTYEGFLLQGYEGMILRDPLGMYKYGKCTAKEQIQLKLKPEEDFDAEVIDLIEAEQNNNEAFINECGETDRSTHQENKVGKGMLGSFLVRDCLTGLQFNVAAGKMKHADRITVWQEFKESGKHIGRYIKYRSMTYGVLKEGAARHGRFYSWRDGSEVGVGL